MGYFIAIDGLDGSGKKTQSDRLAAYLKERGYRVRELDFPVYESDSSYFVKMYLNGELGKNPADTNAYAASMFFAADRYVSYRRDWCDDYNDPDTVIIANRYTTANAIHQLSKLPREMWEDFLTWLFDFEFNRLGLPSPDLVLFLLLPPQISLKMVDSRSNETGRRKDIHELDRSHMDNSYRAGIYAADVLGWCRIDCADSASESMRSRDEIFSDIIERVGKLLTK